MSLRDKYPGAYEVLKRPKIYSHFEDFGDYQLLIIRGVEFGEEAVKYQPNIFLLHGSEISTIAITDLSMSPVVGGIAELSKIINAIYLKNRRVLDLYLEQVDELENQIFDRNTSSYFMDHWANLKRDLSNMDSYYFRNISVYRDFYDNFQEKFGEFDSKFSKIEKIIGYQQASISALKSQLDGVRYHYESIKADRMNKTLFGLTVISGIFLPLNLIVGFFGMNTPGLFFMNNPQATNYVVYILLGVFLIFVLGYHALNLLDRFLFRFLFGRFNMYNSLKNQLEDLSNQLKGK